MKQRIFYLALVFCAVLGLCLTARAARTVDSGDCGDDARWTLDSDGVLTISGAGVVNGGFGSNMDNIKFVRIKDGITEIGDSVFFNCTSLTAVSFPDTLIKIDNEAFYGCRNLTSINFPKSLTTIGEWSNRGIGVFENCSALREIVFSEGLTTIGESAFRYCSNLTEIRLPDTLTDLGFLAFDGCSGLKEIRIPGGLANIGGRVFGDCASLTEIRLPEGVTSVGYEMFWGCRSLKTVILPEGLTAIGYRAFCECESLKELHIPNSLAKISEQAFLFSYLTDVWYRGNQDVWYPGSQLDWQEIEGYQEIPSYAVHYGTENPPDVTWTLDDGLLTISGNSRMWNYEDGGAPWYERRAEIITAKIESGVTSIGNYAFSGCSNMKEITIPDSVTKIGDCVFEGCAALKSVTIPDSVTGIGNPIFNGCTALESVAIPDSVTNMDDSIFAGCTALKSVMIPINASNISNILFFDCRDSLTSLVILGNLGQISASAFNGFANLIDISIPASVKWISFNAFRGCDALKNVYYAGGKSEWGEIYIDDYGNDALFHANIYYGWDDIGLAVKFSDENGDNITSLDDLESDSGREIRPDLSRVNPDNPGELQTVNLFLAFYDDSDMMIFLQSWEIDISNPNNIAWIQTLRIPDGAAKMKIMILNDELIPLRAARELS